MIHLKRASKPAYLTLDKVTELTKEFKNMELVYGIMMI